MTKKSALSLLIALESLVPLPAQQFTTIYSFGAPGEPANPTVSGTISQTPGGNLISSGVGNIQGVHGAAYEISLSGNATILQYFDAWAYPMPFSGLTLATDERFHGAIAMGGKYGHGAVYRISPTPFSEVIYEHDFTGGSDGAYPTAPPIQSMAGDFYGTTTGSYTSPSSDGTVYKITKSEVYSVLHTFSGPDGSNPAGPLVQSGDGSFYGTTPYGGANGQGTIFRINSDGSFKLLYQFSGTDGSQPDGPLIQATDGNLYGLASGGGSGLGVAFEITPGGTFTLLHKFDGAEGAYPYGGLVQATDGNFYGTLYSGGSGDWGSLFRLTPSGVCTKIHDFNGGSDGIEPMGTLLQHTNGKLYGQAYLGGRYGGGTLFEVDAGLPPFVTYLNVYGVVGAKVVILGQGFVDGLSTVRFNGVPAQDVEIDPTYIKATVPEGATTGPITVTTGLFILRSNKVFVVH
ncbi:MAG TPA: choice-of-anchor tandem repeat GloVer-containing protein [Terracidiphilus sp.]|jgi:uncharacterized repeat protein (TIGR03803 family)